MAKYIVVIEPIASYGNLQPQLTREASKVGAQHWRGKLEQGYQALYFQFAKIHSINGHAVPTQWLYRRLDAADVVLVRDECVIDDFEVRIIRT